MAISATCGNCSQSVTVRDEFGGRLVKCPKCKKPMKIPAAQSAKPAVASKAKPASTSMAKSDPPKARHNPLLDLLDEAGVESKPTGPTCPNCYAPMSRSAVVCIECGYNATTGERLQTAVLGELEDDQDEGMTDGQKRLARAEREIADTPFTSDDEDFGDGSESILIALLAGFVLTVLAGIGVVIILFADKFLEVTGLKPEQISLIMAIVIYLGCMVFLAIVAYRVGIGKGLACILTLGVYAIFFGISTGRSLILPAVIMIACLVIGLVSGLVMANSVDPNAMLHLSLQTYLA